MRGKDFTGQQFNRLTAIHRIERNNHGKAVWLFKCSCGIHKELNGTDVSTGRVKSCGCLGKETSRQNSIRGAPKRIKPDAAARDLFQRYKRRAMERGYEFSLTYSQFLMLNKSACHYCDDPPSQWATSKAGILFWYNGIDRVDNKLGYTLANSVACCSLCNQMKHVLPADLFIAQCEKITRKNERHRVDSSK